MNFLIVLVFCSLLVLVKCTDFTNKAFLESIPQTERNLNTNFWKTRFEEQDGDYPSASFECSTEGYFGDQEYCQRFYRCVWSNSTSCFQKFEFNCAPWTLFDVNFKKCEHAQNAKTISGCEYASVQEENGEDTVDNPPLGYEADDCCVYDLRMEYLYGSPDGVLKRIIGFNGVFPGPVLRCTRGKKLIVRVTNTIVDEPTSIHWHGLEQHGTPWFDGPESISQCPIVINSTMTYEFTLRQSGTYWYHSHHRYQYVDGAWGFLIVKNNPKEVYGRSYDKELLISISDWIHRPASNISEIYLTQGIFPSVNSSLINGRGTFNCSNIESGQVCNSTLGSPAIMNVEPGLRYRIRLLSAAGARTYNFSIDDHKLVVIETDGVDTNKSSPVDVISVQPAQRYSILCTMDQTSSDKYWIRISGEPQDSPTLLGKAILRYRPRDGLPAGGADAVVGGVSLQGSSVGVAVEDDEETQAGRFQGRPHFQDIEWDGMFTRRAAGLQAPADLAKYFPTALPSAKSRQREVDERHAQEAREITDPTTSPVDPSTAVLLNQNDCPPYGVNGTGGAPNYADMTVIINMDDCPTPEAPARMCMNGQPYIPGGIETVPTLFQVIKGQELAETSRPIYTPLLKQVIRIVVNNRHFAPHPWHLHGHTIWVLGDGPTLAGDFDPIRDGPNLITNGVRRDTSFTLGNSWAVYAYITNNPGVWFFHCHINWHLEAGLGVTFVEAQPILKEYFQHPPNETRSACERVGVQIGLY